MADRLVVCFDGTWNKPDESPWDGDQNTNVRKFYESVLRGSQDDGVTQWTWYDQGVGTRWNERIRGGAFGYGIDENIKQGYEYLVHNYDPGDEIFVIGFSRGAYTARSLVGLIRNSGLVEHTDRIDDAYALYRRRDDGPDTPEALDFRRTHAREVRIRFLGVWDTVGALGVPLRGFEWLNRREYAFHDAELSGIVDHAYHAVAVDEHRADYRVTLWTRTKPRQTVEQRWFPGAHGNVGGGYTDHELSNLPLRWMQEKALACGLRLDPNLLPGEDPHALLAPVADSYREFLHGLYAFTHPPFYREVGTAADADQVVDASVARKCAADPTYRPRNPGLALA
jgi:uncharacterized protein (DUF2235 family)